ncbi:MAG: hypothetical protein JWO73_891 [Candidatus Taylorbacteria bacterium]|nr:hypothetical protein [Candidatus Taylorbacteria bacterium]
MEQETYRAELPTEKAGEKSSGFIEKSLDRITDMVQHLDHQINIVIGISIAIFAFTASIFEKGESLPILFMMLFSAVAALVGLVAIHPPHSMRKRGQDESLLYRKKIESFSSADDYLKAAQEMTESEEEIDRNYAVETYNLCKFYYRPKRKLFHIARQLLFIGIALSLATFVIELFVF